MPSKRLGEHRKHLRAGSERRDVECYDREVWPEKKVTTIRCDTGETISERAMRADEMQISLNDPEARETWGPGEGPADPPADNVH